MKWYLGPNKCEAPCSDCDKLIWDDEIKSWYEDDGKGDYVSPYPLIIIEGEIT